MQAGLAKRFMKIENIVTWVMRIHRKGGALIKKHKPIGMYSWKQFFAAFMTLAIWVAVVIALGRAEEEDYKSFLLIIGVVSVVILFAYLIKKRNNRGDKRNKDSG